MAHITDPLPPHVIEVMFRYIVPVDNTCQQCGTIYRAVDREDPERVCWSCTPKPANGKADGHVGKRLRIRNTVENIIIPMLDSYEDWTHHPSIGWCDTDDTPASDAETAVLDEICLRRAMPRKVIE